jgi:CubicO group peptidase (beta-lactamase class C family)
MKRTAALALTLLITSLAHGADFAAVDKEVERLMQSGSVPGAAIVVVKEGQVIHSRAYGVTSVETSVPVTTKTLFRLGSTTKMFVALATLKLVDEGRMQLSQPIGELVPGLAPSLRPLTVEQLLTHTAGLSDDAPMSGPLEEAALHERVTSWKDDVLFAPPGEIYSYASTGYALLGDAIAQVTKQPFSAAMRKLVLEPMGMRDSTFLPLEAFTHAVAVGHDRGGVIRPTPEHAGNYPPGSLFTSAEDLGRFFAALQPEQLQRLVRKRVTIAAQDRSYGYGMIVDERRGVTLLLHTGGRSGYGSTFMFLPSQRLAVALISNRTTATLSSAAFEAIEQFTKLAPMKNANEQATLEAAEVAALMGTYVNAKQLPTVELAQDQGNLVVRVAGRTLPVKYAGHDHFSVEGGGQLESFVVVRDKGGVPRYICAEQWAFRKRS